MKRGRAENATELILLLDRRCARGGRLHCTDAVSQLDLARPFEIERGITAFTALRVDAGRPIT